MEAGEDDDGSGRVTLTPFGRWTHDMGSQPTRDIPVPDVRMNPKDIPCFMPFYSLDYYDASLLYSIQD